MGTHGSPYARFQLALRSGNLPLDPSCGVRSRLDPAPRWLAILLVIDAKAEERFDSAAVRWAGRIALEIRAVTLDGFAGALQSLVAQPDENAQRSLLALCDRAVRSAGVRQAPTGPRPSQSGRSRGLLQ